MLWLSYDAPACAGSRPCRHTRAYRRAGAGRGTGWCRVRCNAICKRYLDPNAPSDLTWISINTTTSGIVFALARVPLLAGAPNYLRNANPRRHVHPWGRFQLTSPGVGRERERGKKGKRGQETGGFQLSFDIWHGNPIGNANASFRKTTLLQRELFARKCNRCSDDGAACATALGTRRVPDRDWSDFFLAHHTRLGKGKSGTHRSGKNRERKREREREWGGGREGGREGEDQLWNEEAWKVFKEASSA